MKVLVLHGPNLNLLGEREPEHYGALTLDELNARLAARAAELGHELRVFQSNHEGALIDRLHEERRWMDALVINPGALGHTSYALRDAIAAVKTRAIEVHLSEVHAREPWRRVSTIADVCERQISGKGEGSYLEALEHLAGVAPAPSEPNASQRREEPRPAQRGKTIGRRAEVVSPAVNVPHTSATRPAGVLTRGEVEGWLSDRLAGKAPRPDLARAAYAALLKGDLAPEDESARDPLEAALLTLLVPGSSDEALLSALARLQR